MAYERIDWSGIVQTADLLTVIEIHVPELKGKFHNGMTPEVPCPKCGGKTRFRVRLGKNGLMMAFCSHCAEHGLNAIQYISWYNDWSKLQSAKWWLDNTTTSVVGPKPTTVEEVKSLDMAMVLRNHARMPAQMREYLYRRGMTDPWINHFKIGYDPACRRYSIPMIYQKECWAVQYRIDPRIEYVVKWLALFGIDAFPLRRYMSAKGGHNHQLYAAEEISAAPWPYTILVEGVMDVVALWSAGFPAIATFQGNNRAKPWDIKWNRFLAGVDAIYVIPDNDQSGAGEVFAELKVQAIGTKAQIRRIPNTYKDVGEVIQVDPNTATERLAKVLGVTPVPNLPL